MATQTKKHPTPRSRRPVRRGDKITAKRISAFVPNPSHYPKTPDRQVVSTSGGGGTPDTRVTSLIENLPRTPFLDQKEEGPFEVWNTASGKDEGDPTALVGRFVLVIDRPTLISMRDDQNNPFPFTLNPSLSD